MRFWDMQTRRQAGSYEPFGAIAWHPDGQHLLLCARKGLQQLSVRRHEDHGSLSLEVGGEEILHQINNPTQVWVSPDGQSLLVCQGGIGAYILSLRQTNSAPLLLSHKGRIVRATWSPDSKWRATFTWQGYGVKIWEAQSGTFVRDVISDYTSTARFSPDGRWLVTISSAAYRFWEAGSWQPRHSVPRDGTMRGGGPMAFSPDGSLLAVSHLKQGVRLVESSTGRKIATLDSEDQWPLCFSPDGTQLVTADLTGVVRIWDLRRLREGLAKLNLDWDLPPYPPALP